jgi:hypothetical protein
MLQFFSALQQARNTNAFAGAELAAVIGAATPIMTLAHAGAKAIGITGAALGLAAATIINYGQFALLTQYNAELQDLVSDAQTSYKSKIAIDHPDITHLTSAQAYTIVSGYAWLCTLPGIDSLAHKALATAQTTAKTTQPLTPTEIAAVEAVGQKLGVSKLTADKAAALLLFYANPSLPAASENLRTQLTSAELTGIFMKDSGTGTALTPKDSAGFQSAMVLLQGLQKAIPGLDQRVKDQAGALAKGTQPKTPSLAETAPLPETRLQRPSLGIIIPQIQIVR